jgi:hypothetical protein
MSLTGEERTEERTDEELTHYQLAMTHPFYNQDLFSVIMKFCLVIGVKTATMCASTHKFTLPFRKKIECLEMTHYFCAKRGFKLRANCRYCQAFL